MEKCIEKDKRYEKIVKICRMIYALTAIYYAVQGIVHQSAYQASVAAGTLILIPGMYLLRRLTRWKGGWQLETYIYVFVYLSWMLGGAGFFYDRVPYFDKFVHCLSGVFVSVLALASYRMLERGHSREGENPATVCLFVFFTSMAVAGLFELCEFTMTPIMGRDLQHVEDSGVTDTMQDMLVCLVGTLAAVGLMLRNCWGKHDPFTDAAEAFAVQNPCKNPVKTR